MLSSLAIRDVVLIERLDLAFGPGLTALTGETGAGKSILLDSLGLALGQRAEAGMVRAGQSQASVAAAFHPPAGHPAFDLLREQGIESEDDLVLRRVVQADGRSRAFVNDQPVGVALLRRLGALLVEVQGQHDQVGLADPASHGGLLDAFGTLEPRRVAAAEAWSAWRTATKRLVEARAAIAAAQREEEWLRHAVAELKELAAEEGEEDRLATERQRLQQGERRAEAIATAIGELTPRDRRAASPARALREAARALERLPPPNEDAQPALVALAAAQDALAEAESALSRLLQEGGPDPRRLEVVEERLFALRAAARKHSVPVVELPVLAADLRARLEALDAGSGRVAALERDETAARRAYFAAGAALTEARREAASRLEKAVAKELPPLKLDRTRLAIDIAAREEFAWGPDGQDRIAFLVSTNPGQTPGQLAKIASGGELSRLMLALKVVLARGSPVPTLVFDEVDSGIGGATAAAVGERLARVAERLQVLVVTHSPQVAARGAAHLRVAKQVKGGRAETRVETLPDGERREELARMLAGEKVTDAARAAARKACSRMGGDRKNGGENSPVPPPFSGTPPLQTGSAVTARRAAGSDAAALEPMIAAMNRDQGDPVTPTDLRRDLIDNDSAIVLVAEAPGQGLIGYVTAHHTYETGHAEHGLYVGDLYVAPAHRRQGIARALLAALARQGHARGARHLWLTAKPGNTAAHAFYRRLGSRGESVIAFAVVEQDFLNLAAEQPR